MRAVRCWGDAREGVWVVGDDGKKVEYGCKCCWGDGWKKQGDIWGACVLGRKQEGL